VNDQGFLQALETCSLPECEFGHRAHVRAAYLYLRDSTFAGALERLQRAIGDYATSLGRPNRYHETITVAYAALIQQHIVERGAGENWQAFARANPELFQPDLLLHFYPKKLLQSDLARRVFVLPAHPGSNSPCA
jgi:hypothetical protein